LLVPEPSRTAEKLFDKSPVGVCSLRLIGYPLRLKQHRLLDRSELPFRNCQCPLPDCFGEGLFRHERINEAAAQGFSRSFQALYCEIPVGFAVLKLDDAGLLHPEPFRQLCRGHAKGFADGAYPSTGGTHRLSERL
jgi:hypothetical protein